MSHHWEVKVRASETDGLGHVSNISYFIYLEEARIEVFRELGTMLAMDKWPFILASTTCDYIQQAYFDERLQIETTISRIGNSSFDMTHHISNERGLIARGKAVIVYFDFETQRSEPLPEAMREKMAALNEAEAVKEGDR